MIAYGAWCVWLPWISRSVCAIQRHVGGQHDISKMLYIPSNLFNCRLSYQLGAVESSATVPPTRTPGSVTSSVYGWRRPSQITSWPRKSTSSSTSSAPTNWSRILTRWSPRTQGALKGMGSPSQAARWCLTKVTLHLWRLLSHFPLKFQKQNLTILFNVTCEHFIVVCCSIAVQCVCVCVCVCVFAWKP